MAASNRKSAKLVVVRPRALLQRGQRSQARAKHHLPIRCQQHTHNSNGILELEHQTSSLDAIVVLGGGLTPTGAIPGWGKRRLQTALQLYKHSGEVCPILCLGGGTPHKPAVLSDTGHVVHEGSAYAAHLHKDGVPNKHLLKEVSSYDTVGNAYFSLVIHAIPAKWRRLAVVTSDFHMPRSQAIFEHCFKLAGVGKAKADRSST